MFSVVNVALEILMLRGTRAWASAESERRKYTPEDREASYRALLRDVILGSLAVIVLALAVPTWIIRVEYSKTYGRAPGTRPMAEVLRERALGAVTPRIPRVIELAEQIVRREAQRRERKTDGAERTETARHETDRRNAPDSPRGNPDVHIAPAGAQPAKVTPSAANSPQFGFRESAQAP